MVKRKFRRQRVKHPMEVKYNGYRVFRGGNVRPGRGVDRPSLSSAEVEGGVQQDLYSPSGPPWPVIGFTVPLPLPSVKADIGVT
jgi:hypothetical protein